MSRGYTLQQQPRTSGHQHYRIESNITNVLIFIYTVSISLLIFSHPAKKIFYTYLITSSHLLSGIIRFDLSSSSSRSGSACRLPKTRLLTINIPPRANCITNKSLFVLMLFRFLFHFIYSDICLDIFQKLIYVFNMIMCCYLHLKVK